MDVYNRKQANVGTCNLVTRAYSIEKQNAKRAAGLTLGLAIRLVTIIIIMQLRQCCNTGGSWHQTHGIANAKLQLIKNIWMTKDSTTINRASPQKSMFSPALVCVCVLVCLCICL